MSITSSASITPQIEGKALEAMPMLAFQEATTALTAITLALIMAALPSINHVKAVTALILFTATVPDLKAILA